MNWVLPTCLNCKKCEKNFKNIKSLHIHIAKSHDLELKNYYEEYFPRYNLATQLKRKYIDFEDYFLNDFESEKEMREWFYKGNPVIVKKWIKDRMLYRIKDKKLKFTPSFNDLISSKNLPLHKDIIYFYGSYEAFCKEIGYEPLFKTCIEKLPEYNSDFEILIDTREKKPLIFKKSRSQKLIIGDYTSASVYSYTYIDRKSPQDLFGTLSQGYDRFKREIERAIDFESYVYVLVESSIDKIKENFEKGLIKGNINLVFHRMRELHNLYPRNIQFVFISSRTKSQWLIPYLLFYGKKIWDKDIQFLLDKKGI